MNKIEGRTNVSSLRTGKDALSGLGKELGRFIVTTMEVPWAVAGAKLGGIPEKIILIETMEESWLESLAESIPPCDTVVGIGGGQAIDAAKYLAWKKGLRLVSVPTILSVNAFVTPAAGIRRHHEVIYVGEGSHDPLVIDMEILQSAPPQLNIAGLGDLLSMHTASFDWERAARAGHSEFPFSAQDVEKARKILLDTDPLLTEIRGNSESGLMAIVEGYMRLNTICLPAGHYRVEEGSEHYLFYELEERLQRPFIHGNIIGLGIFLMSRLQKNGHEEVVEQMNRAGLDFQPAGMGISRADLEASLGNLRSFVAQRPKLWYTVINEEPITPEWISEALDQLSF